MLFVKEMTYLLIILEIAKYREAKHFNNVSVLGLNKVWNLGISVLIKIDIRGFFLKFEF